MNKKTLYFLGVAGVVVAVAISIQRGKTPHAEPSSPAVASKPAVRPSVPVSRPSTNIVVRAVEARQTDEEMDVEKPSVSAAIRCIVGSETSSADRYLVRSRALESLGDMLSPTETKALLNYLASTRDPLRPERVAALKNDILNVLRSQKSISPDLAPCLIGLFNAKKHDSAILDYCIQHLGALQEQLDDPAQLDKIVRCIRSASLLEKESYAGTALIAMTHQRNPSDDDKAFLKTRTTAILENPKAHEAARISAMQIASENGYVGKFWGLSPKFSAGKKKWWNPTYCFVEPVCPDGWECKSSPPLLIDTDTGEHIKDEDGNNRGSAGAPDHEKRPKKKRRICYELSTTGKDGWGWKDSHNNAVLGVWCIKCE